MMRILLSLFTVFMIFVSFTHEAHEIKVSVDNAESTKVEKSKLDHPEHCDDHDSGSDHCHIHCTGLHFLANLEHTVQLKLPLLEIHKTQTPRLDFFKSPYLDPAKKPPSLS
ncbi:hypothetical protein [Halobacteriovorax sp. CON-3]|uniref:hypothetical protein n=1 Tax=Halobacteriovorax sp. CON-3 TaxID=3157710 RepID=UPI0037201E1A